MPETKFPYLCGGVLYFLLAQTKASRGTARDHRDGIKDDHSDPIMMSDLVYTFTGSKNYGAGKDTSEYRECKKEGSINVPFNDASVASAYDAEVRNRYNIALDRMCEFVDWHIDDKKQEWLVRALLDIIEHDSDIPDSDNFYIQRDGTPVSKSDVRDMDYFEIQPFLVGVVHYILTVRRDCNHHGTATLDAWGEKKERKERRYVGNAGDGINRVIEVKPYTSAENEKSAPLEEPEEPEAEYVEAEVIDDAPQQDQEESCTDSKTTVIYHQTNVIQNGENNNQITNNGTMVFDFRKTR